MRERLHDPGRQTRKMGELVHKLWECQNDSLSVGERPQHFNIEDVMTTKITKEVFDHTLQIPSVQEWLEDLDIPEDDRMDLFDVLDADGGGTLQLEELVDGIIKLRGDSRRSDVVHVGLVVRSVHDQLTKSVSTVAEQVRLCKANVEEILAALRPIERGPGSEEAYPGPRVKQVRCVRGSRGVQPRE